VGDYVWVLEQRAGHVDPSQLELVWTSPGFDHCMFDALPTLSTEKRTGFERALFSMVWENPSQRCLLELEGLRQWMPPREQGYDSLCAALDDQGGW